MANFFLDSSGGVKRYVLETGEHVLKLPMPLASASGW
jgi:hypothetical protein